MDYGSIFYLVTLLLVGSIGFSRRDPARWRRMLSGNIGLMGLGVFTASMAFVGGLPGIVFGLAGLIPASLASMHLSRKRLAQATARRRRFQVSRRAPELTAGEALLREQDRIDEADEHRKLGRRIWSAFFPAGAMAVTALQFGSVAMGVISAGVAILTAWTVQPAFQKSRAPLLEAPDSEDRPEAIAPGP